MGKTLSLLMSEARTLEIGFHTSAATPWRRSTLPLDQMG
jgi:hypothetical protein